MSEKLEELICECIQDDCVGHCNYPYCYKVKNIVENLNKKNNILVAPYGIKDKIWFITGVHNTLAKEARIEEIHYNGDEFSYTVSTSFVTFDLQAHEVFATKEEAEKEIKHGN